MQTIKTWFWKAVSWLFGKIAAGAIWVKAQADNVL